MSCVSFLLVVFYCILVVILTVALNFCIMLGAFCVFGAISLVVLRLFVALFLLVVHISCVRLLCWQLFCVTRLFVVVFCLLFEILFVDCLHFLFICELFCILASLSSNVHSVSVCRHFAIVFVFVVSCVSKN